MPDSPVSIGPNLCALAVYLVVYQHVPIERCRELIADAAGALVPAGQKMYVHGAFTEPYSLFFLGARTLESMREFGILPSFGGVVVSDRYVNYFHEDWEYIAGHQACLAHILRDYQDAAETYPDAIWPVQAQWALRGPIRLRFTADTRIWPTNNISERGVRP